MVLEPYRAAFEYVEPEELEEIAENDAEKEKARLAKPEIPPHRYLFNCYVYQYHLIQFASIVREMVRALFVSSPHQPLFTYLLFLRGAM